MRGQEDCRRTGTDSTGQEKGSRRRLSTSLTQIANCRNHAVSGFWKPPWHFICRYCWMPDLSVPARPSGKFSLPHPRSACRQRLPFPEAKKATRCEGVRYHVEKRWETPAAFSAYAIGIPSRPVFRRVPMSVANCTFRVVFRRTSLFRSLMA
jgi:hypothetical protein